MKTACCDIAIIESSQAISGEIIMDKLLEKILAIVVENTGARRCCLIMKENNQLTIFSEIDMCTGKEFNLISMSAEKAQGFAKSIVQHVNSTMKPIVLGDAANEGLFTHDPYVVSLQLKSILCVPVLKQEEIYAILYLENNIATGAFTPDHVRALNLIATQIWISIENARLFQSIEKKMEERTMQLHEKSELLTIAGEVLTQVNDEMTLEIEQRKLLEEELRKLATTDHLTGLFIRRQLFELGEKEISRAQRNGSPLSLMILDVDHFKSVNDTYGHAIGDEVLKGFSMIFRDSLRNIDIICRFGGEEFVAILPETDTRVAMEVAQRLRKNVAASAMPIKGENLKYTISIGLTGLQEKDTSINQLINRADEALYHAKKSGRNQVVLAPEAQSLPPH